MLAISHAHRGTHDLSVHQQIQAGLTAQISTPDQKTNIFSLDEEAGRSQRPDVAVTAQKCVHQSMTLKTIHDLLIGCGTLRRAGTKRRAGHRPNAARQPDVVRLLKVGQQNVLTLNHGSASQEQHEVKQVSRQ